MWMGCSRRESILRAARAGLGALVFGFVEPEQAGQWIKEYYDIIKSEACVPIGHSVNPNIAAVTALSVHPDEDEAIRRGLDGFRFFGYSLAHYTNFGEHNPAVPISGRGSNRCVTACRTMPGVAALALRNRSAAILKPMPRSAWTR